MKRFLLSLSLWLSLCALASAQVPCVGVGGVNTVPIVGVACEQEPLILTASAVGYGILPAASATDVACITGAANTVVRVQRVRLFGTAGSAISLPVVLMYRTVADTGGTAATTTALPVPFAIDGGSGTSPKATTIAYTGNPTVNDGTNREIAGANLNLTTTTTLTGVVTATTFDWSYQRTSEAPTLRTAAQQVCVNLTSTSITTGSLGVEFAWTEAAQ